MVATSYDIYRRRVYSRLRWRQSYKDMTPFQAAKYGILGFGLATKPQKEAACDRNGVKGFLPLDRAPREMFHEPTITVGAAASRAMKLCRSKNIMPNWCRLH